MPNPFKLNPPCLCRVLLRRRLEGRADKNVMDVIIKDIKAKGRLKTRYIDLNCTPKVGHIPSNSQGAVFL